MKEVGFMKKATGVIAAAVVVLTAMPTPEVHAQTSNTIFPEGWDKSVRNRMFMRLGPIAVNTKTDSSDAVDMTGPVLTRADVIAVYTRTGGQFNVAGEPNGQSNLASRAQFAADYPDLLLSNANGGPQQQWPFLLFALLNTPELSAGGSGVGTPPGVKAKVGNGATMAMSLGYWLTEDYTWMLEAFLLAKPIEVKAYGAGINGSGNPNGLSGKHILNLKMLPPLAVLSRHFGSASNRFRPFVGIGATYAVIYDARTTGFYDAYVGGSTSVSVKNAFGVGPFVGLSSRLNDNWSINFQVGQIKLKTDAILTTRNTKINSASAVTADFSETFAGAVELGLPDDPEIVTKMMQIAALDKPGGQDMGTFARKQSNKLTATIFNLSIGYSF